MIVAATWSSIAAGRTIDSLGLANRDDVEVVVAGSGFDGGGEAGRKVVWIDAPEGAEAPLLRWLGLAYTSAPVVAFTEDCCTLEPGWLDAWISAFEASPSLVAAGGWVRQSEEQSRAIDRGVFAFEYGDYVRKRLAAPFQISGCNFAVRRQDAERCADSGRLFETDFDGRSSMRDIDSQTCARIESAGASHVRSYGVFEALADRFRFGVDFGRLRRTRGDSWLLGLFALPAIAFVQSRRVLSNLRAMAPNASRCFFEQPLAVLLALSWSLGEWAGWVLPAPRSSDGRRHERTEPLSIRPSPAGS